MAHIGTLRDFKFKGDVDDIRGANLYGRGNEKLGKVDDVVFDHAGGTIQYLVVDTGGWLMSNKFLVPADRVNARGDHGEDFTCDLSKDQIERFPEYKDSIIRNNDDWDAYEQRYRGTISTEGDVLHKEGGFNLITPEASEMPAMTGSGEDIGSDVTPTRLVDKFSTPEPVPDKTRLRPAGTASRVEDSKFPGRSITNENAAWTEPAGEVRNRRATDHPIEENRIGQESLEEDAITEQFVAGRIEDEPILSDESRFDNLPTQVIEDGRKDPPSYRAGLDSNSRIGNRYASNRRLADFEETLRRNRVDITATCRACGVEHDEIEHRRKDDAA
jgi:sporulation protein YlmC with PRC-barrel domain